MARLTNEQWAELWSNRLSLGLKFREEQTSKHWDKLIRFLLGDQWDEMEDEYPTVSNHVVINIMWPIVRAYVPSLYLDDPYLVIREDLGAISDADMELADTVQDQERWFEGLVNKRWKGAESRENMRDALTDAIIFPYGVIKTGWYEVPQDSFDANSEGDRIDNLSAYNRRVSPRDIVIDPMARKFSEARWIGWTYVRPYMDVMADSRYRNNWSKIEPTHYATLPDEMDDGLLQSRDKAGSGDVDEAVRNMDAYVRFWEIITHENGGRIFTFTQAVEPKEVQTDLNDSVKLELLLTNEERPYRYVKDFPYTFLSFNDVPDVLYPPSDLQMAKELQQQLNLIRSIQADHVTNMKTVYLCDQQIVNDDLADTIQEAPDHSLIPVEADKPLDQIVYPMTRNAVASDIYINQDIIKGEVFTMVGADQASRNEVSKDETATATMQRAKMTSIRMQDRMLTVKNWIEKIADKFVNIILNEDDPNIVFPVVVQDVGGTRQALQFKIADFGQAYTIRLETQNAFPISREIEMSQFLSAVNLTSNNPFVSQRELANRVFEMFKVRNIDELVPAINLPPELVEMLTNDPQFFQVVMAMAQQYVKQQEMEAQQQGAGGGGGQGRVMADVNQVQQAEAEMNRGGMSAAQGGAGRNF